MELQVHILLASYNGEKYIKTQLDSILAQTHYNWRLLIRDDGSTDNTMSIIEKYVNIDDRITLIDTDINIKGKGACQNFASLLKVAVLQKASYIMFSDQDDYWLANKIELMLSSIISSNSKMVYSDFLYADENLKELPVSIQKAKASFVFPSFKSLIVNNNVYGCTIMIDGDLAKMCLPIPVEAENHDYWITLVASGTGVKIYHLKQALMLYRQHATNVTGSYKEHTILPRIKRFLVHFNILIKNEYKKILMLNVFNGQFNNELSFDNKKLLSGFFKALEKGRIHIVYYCIKNKIKRHSFMSTIVYLTILFNLQKLNFLKK